jgi:hypothetical protein
VLPRSTEGRLILVIVALGLLLMGAGAEIQRLRARPMTQERVKVVRGPTRTIVKTVTTPGGERIVERIREVASETRESEHEEKPACPVVRKRYVRATLDPLLSGAPRAAAAGLTIWDRLDLGGSYDWRAKAVGVEVGARF